MTDEERFRDEFRAEVRRLDSARQQQELGFTTLKGDVQRIEGMVRTGSALTIGEMFVSIDGRLKNIESGEVERKDFAKWMKRVMPFTVLALFFSFLGAAVALWRAAKGG